MSLACCAFDDDYRPDIWQVERRTARKQYVCDGCGREIRPGDEYRHTSELFEGLWYKYRHCETCDSLLGAFGEVGLCAALDSVPSAYRQYLEEFVPQWYDDDADVYRLHNGRTVDEQVARVFP